MRSPQFKALMMILLILGSLGAYISKELGLLDRISESISFNKEKKSRPIKKTSKSGAAAGAAIDSYKGVKVYYNGSVRNVSGRNVTKDGYNLGLKYQCVEFAKRFYYEAYNHKMPDSYGHARDFFDANLAGGSYNQARGMLQYKQGGSTRPKTDDLIVIGPTSGNQYGHLMVVTKVTDSAISFIQQNPGRSNPSRGTLALESRQGGWFIKMAGIRGWLRIS